ncbi:MAG TPA: hypothetical protein VK191_13560 [Symbiobacteriaceae bacterium]|nr:hypothetical protein [Symbiobacteriaceae bacterium]
MSLYPLKSRLETLPLIIAGPMLRQVSPTSVTVWVALRAKARVSLTVKPSTGNDVWGGVIAETVAPVETVALGPNLHLLAVTAPTKDGLRLSPGHLYGYNLTFTDVAGGLAGGDLFAAKVFANDAATAKQWLTYSSEGFAGGAPSLPSFVFRPEHPNDLRIAQGSCRKAHGESMDALSLLDAMIKQTFAVGATEPRPHLLMLGGDQIYADDVADPLLQLLIDAGEALLGKEVFPAPPDGKAPPTAVDFKPGRRWDVADRIKLTAGADGDNGTSKSHLLTLTDWYTMYLFAWSDVLWPTGKDGKLALPYYHDVYGGELPGELRKRWSTDYGEVMDRFKDEVERLELYHRTLRQVRRALANVPTYMIFDDHEVTDDWLLNREWCNGLLNKQNPMGRQVMQNGLLAYTLFQGWGNTPERFGDGTLGAQLLTAATQFWNDGSEAQKAKSEQIQRLLGMPVFEGGKETFRPADSIKFHYQITTSGWEMIVLNTRTRRKYPGLEMRELPDMLDEVAFDQQIPKGKVPSSDFLTMVVAPTNVISEWLTETAVEILSDEGKKPFGTDAGDAWAGQREGFERLLGALADRAADVPSGRRKARVVVLSGDIHYSFAFRMQYWADAPYRAAAGAQPVDLVLAELTASSFKNEALKTRALDWAKTFTLFTTPWWGWRTPLTGAHYALRMTKPSRSDFEIPVPGLDRTKLEKTPALMGKEHLPKIQSVSRKPDWRYVIDMVPARYAPMGGAPVPIDSKPSMLTSGWWLERHNELVGFLHGESLNVLRGRMVVGANNLGDVRFQWGAGEEKSASLRLWWRSDEDDEPTAWRTNFSVPLSFDPDKNKPPMLPGEE